jgi:hypothetical protein
VRLEVLSPFLSNAFAILIAARRVVTPQSWISVKPSQLFSSEGFICLIFAVLGLGPSLCNLPLAHRINTERF